MAGFEVIIEVADLKTELQSRIGDGLVTIVGSGLSAASGMPTMGKLAQYLLSNVPPTLDPAHKHHWDSLALQLSAGTDLETVLRAVDDDSPLLDPIVSLTTQFMQTAERDVLARVMSSVSALPFERLLPHLGFATSRIPVITPNYDRLLEFAIERSGYGLDTGFSGQYFGAFDPQRSKDSLRIPRVLSRRKDQVQFEYRKHVVLAKPHGSLDWYLINDRLVRSAIQLPSANLIITPGRSKYRKGYDAPFDHHRSVANNFIDAAARFLIIGYGFNDDQLETHLRLRLRSGVPALVLAMELTDNAKRVAQENKTVLAIERQIQLGVEGCCVWQNGTSSFAAEPDLWNLDKFISQVLE